MTNKMLKFVDIGQQNPPKRDKSQRKEDFGEIYQEFIHEKAKDCLLYTSDAADE